jgi:hypothetical protein
LELVTGVGSELLSHAKSCKFSPWFVFDISLVAGINLVPSYITFVALA